MILKIIEVKFLKNINLINDAVKIILKINKVLISGKVDDDDDDNDDDDDLMMI